MNKEEVYDELISPLMTKIIDICKEHGVAMIANFAIPVDCDDDLQVTTRLFDGNDQYPDNHAAASMALRIPCSSAMITVTKEDGSKEITAPTG